MSYTNGIVKHFEERQPGIVGASLRAGRRRARDTAHAMSRRGAMAASAELVNTAVSRLIELAYEQDEIGLCNVDAVTGVFAHGFSMPWSTRRYMRYGLQRTEADVLAIHVRRLHEIDIPPLFTYDATTRRWGVNLFDYAEFGQAVAYWQRCQLSARDYQMILQTVRNRRADV